jgi:hypothetical protein
MKMNKDNSLKKLLSIFAATLSIIFALSFVSCKESPNGPNDDKTDEKTPRTSVPAALVGEWQTGTVSSVNFYNPTTGVWGAPSGTGMFFKFTQDGYYEKGVLLQSSLYGHTSTFFAYNKGTMTVEDNMIVLYPTYGKIKSVDNMVQENNYEKPDELKSETMLWEKGFDEYGLETLWLRYPDSGPSAFYHS